MRDVSNAYKEKQVSSYQKEMDAATAKVDNDLASLREGFVAPDSEEGKQIRAKLDAAKGLKANAATIDNATLQFQETATTDINSTVDVSFDLAYKESDKKEYEPEATKVNLVVGERFIKSKITREQERADAIESQIKNGSYANKDDRLAMVRSGRVALEISAQSLQQGDVAKSNFALKVGTVFLDTAISVTPVLGWAKDGWEAVTGRNLLTGEELSGFERTMAVVGVLTAGIGSKLALAGKAAVLIDVLKAGKATEEAAEVVKLTSKAAEAVSVGKKYGFSTVDEAKSFARNFEEVNEAGFRGVLYPRGPGAASGAVPAGHVPVSRWVSESEVKAWYSGGGTRIPPDVGAGGRVYVTAPGAPRPGGTGGSRIDFSLPESMLNKAGNDQWFQIFQETANTPIYNVKIFLE
jgi:hypothetical protein